MKVWFPVQHDEDAYAGPGMATAGNVLVGGQPAKNERTMARVNKIRTYCFLARVFENQQHDPFCRVCKARVNSVTATRESLARFENEHSDEIGVLPGEFQQLLADTKSILARLVLPENASGQKKAGNCKLPEGLCFVKASLAILQKI